MNKENTEYRDIIIIGASLSGSFCAYLLAQNNVFSKLVDVQTPASKKACGEGLSLIGVRYLHKAGLWKQLKEHARPYKTYEIYTGRKILKLKSMLRLGYGVEREEIDKALFFAAKNSPYTEFHNDRALSIEPCDGKWKIKFENSCILAKFVVIACGLNGRGLIMGNKSPELQKERYGISFKASGSWEKQAPSKVFIKNSENKQIIITVVSDKKINVSILINKNNQRESKNSITAEALLYASSLGFKVEQNEECRGASSIESSVVINSCPGIYCIGDTAEIFDPIGGMGMSHAFFSASIASKYILKSLIRPQHANHYWSNYNKQRAVLSKLFKIMTSISNSFITSKSNILFYFCYYLPNISALMPALFGRLFPVLGLARKRKLEKKVLYNYFINQEARLYD